MIIYGVPFINLDEWKEYTDYEKPYSVEHKVIKILYIYIYNYFLYKIKSTLNGFGKFYQNLMQINWVNFYNFAQDQHVYLLMDLVS